MAAGASGIGLADVRDQHCPPSPVAENSSSVQRAGVAASGRAEVYAPSRRQPRHDVSRRYGAEEVPDDRGDEETDAPHDVRIMRIRTFVGVFGVGALTWALVARGSLALDLGVGRRYQLLVRSPCGSPPLATSCSTSSRRRTSACSAMMSVANRASAHACRAGSESSRSGRITGFSNGCSTSPPGSRVWTTIVWWFMSALPIQTDDSKSPSNPGPMQHHTAVPGRTGRRLTYRCWCSPSPLATSTVATRFFTASSRL